MLYALSTTKYYIRAEEDFHKEINVERTKKKKKKRNKKEITTWESGELSGEFME